MYAFPARPEVETLDTIIIGMIFVSYDPACALFDTESTYSYVSIYYAMRLDVLCEPLPMPMHVATPVGDS